MKKILFLLVYTLYAANAIYNTSAVVNNERYFLLADDAVISMQYAKNLVHGNGLMWYEGNRVEGITNPLWTLYMAIPHALNIPLSKTALFIQITAYLFMLLTLYLVWKLSKNPYAVILTAFFVPMNFWFYSGMEVSALTFLSVLTVYMILKEKNPLYIYLICGVMTLIRIDSALFFAAVIFICRKQWKTGLVIFAAFMGGQTLFRLMYYGELLPNTYYLKMEHYSIVHRLARGIASIVNNTYFMNWASFLIVIPFIKTKEEKIMAFFIALSVAYTVYIGGDVWEPRGGTNRFITPFMPLFFILFAGAMDNILKILKVENRFIKIAVLALFFLNFNALTGPKSLKYLAAAAPETKASGNTLKIALYLKDNYNKDIVIASQGAGVITYFSGKNRYVDLLGKNDKRIARMKITVIDSFWKSLTIAPGHMKFDQNYSIKELKPDVVVHPVMYEDILPYLKEHYTESEAPGYSMVWFKKNMQKIP